MKLVPMTIKQLYKHQEVIISSKLRAKVFGFQGPHPNKLWDNKMVSRNCCYPSWTSVLVLGWRWFGF
jgi:hypothetical protein